MSLKATDRTVSYSFGGSGGSGPYGSHLDCDAFQMNIDTQSSVVKGSIQTQGIYWYGGTYNDVSGNTYCSSGYNYSILSGTLQSQMHSAAIDTQQMLVKGSLNSNAAGMGPNNGRSGYIYTSSRMEALAFANDVASFVIKGNCSNRSNAQTGQF